MSDAPQIKCPSCKTLMPYTAATCPNCKRRMVATTGNPNSGSGVQMASKNAIGGIIAAGVIFLLMIFCCLSGKQSPESPEERRVRERREEMQPLHDEMNRKMREGKTREEAAREIVDEEVRRQEQKKRAEQNK